MKVFEKKIKKAQELKAEEETRLRLEAAVAYKERTPIKHFHKPNIRMSPQKRARISSIYERLNSPSVRRPTMLALFGTDESSETLRQYPTALQDSKTRKVSRIENIDETLPPNRPAVIGKIRFLFFSL